MREVETLAVEAERAVGCALRVVFWTLFVVYTAVLAVAGWALYNYVLLSHPIQLSNNHKDALIVGLAVVVLGTLLAAITRDQLVHAIFRWGKRRQNR